MTNFQRDLIRYLETTEGTDSEEYGTIAKEFFFGGAEYWKSEYREEDYTPASWKNMNVSFELVAYYGGEGQGDDYWSVYKFTDNISGEEVFIKFDGWYQSYNGAEYTGLSVVQPVEKLVTFYE